MIVSLNSENFGREKRRMASRISSRTENNQKKKKKWTIKLPHCFDWIVLHNAAWLNGKSTSSRSFKKASQKLRPQPASVRICSQKIFLILQRQLRSFESQKNTEPFYPLNLFSFYKTIQIKQMRRKFSVCFAYV